MKVKGTFHSASKFIRLGRKLLSPHMSNIIFIVSKLCSF
jgi:hypothetical protein